VVDINPGLSPARLDGSSSRLYSSARRRSDFPAFDGSNIWHPVQKLGIIPGQRASTGVPATLTGNGLAGARSRPPTTAIFITNQTIL
jgi:hypothetical protein